MYRCIGLRVYVYEACFVVLGLFGLLGFQRGCWIEKFRSTPSNRSTHQRIDAVNASCFGLGEVGGLGGSFKWFNVSTYQCIILAKLSVSPCIKVWACGH